MSKKAEKFWKMFEGMAFVKTTNSITGEVEENPTPLMDMESTIGISGEFDKIAIDEWLEENLK